MEVIAKNNRDYRKRTRRIMMTTSSFYRVYLCCARTLHSPDFFYRSHCWARVPPHPHKATHHAKVSSTVSHRDRKYVLASIDRCAATSTTKFSALLSPVRRPPTKPMAMPAAPAPMRLSWAMSLAVVSRLERDASRDAGKDASEDISKHCWPAPPLNKGKDQAKSKAASQEQKKRGRSPV